MPWVLLFVVMVTGIISSLGAPLIPSISDDLGVSLSAAQWSLTATLLVGVELDAAERRREEEDAELAGAGLPGVPAE